ncbi:MAG: SRPBCC family protein [Acidobacteria bacterium]|nr:SRPBCC family protein [Acidobacteriota bacterium]
MKTIRHQIEIMQSQQVVFDATQDYSRRLDWDPYLAEAYLLNGKTRADVGVDAFCRNRWGTAMITRYITFDRPRVAAIEMVNGPFLLKRFCGAWNVKAMNDQSCLLVFTYHFVLKGSPWSALLLPVVVHMFSREMKKRLLAIKHHLERTA